MVLRSCPRAWWRAVPSSWRPDMSVAPTSQRFEWPVAQGGHCPQAGTNPKTTWSPGASPRTPGPTSSTTPAPSCPPMMGSEPGRSPVTRCSSEWHMPDAASLTSTSPSRGGSSSIGSTLQSPCLSHKIAASVCMVSPSVEVSRVRRNLPGPDGPAAQACPGAAIGIARAPVPLSPRGSPRRSPACRCPPGGPGALRGPVTRGFGRGPDRGRGRQRYGKVHPVEGHRGGGPAG